ncbi:transporter substrate-binding domain-containing protein [Raoultella ornithinolytica]|uniref:transporter substrate-binding domain-containing protein n=1 Tax=Raoultella ornithinolytica TaxID=54291 RepID=UPI0021BA5E98|nr:transporter substrate-binding domain-containing protein [Raoultella ornithinolytica]
MEIYVNQDLILVIKRSRSRPDPLPLGIYVAKGNSELVTAIKSTLTTLKANGKYDAIIKKYNLERID